MASSIKLAGAFIGLMVGVGFASGQEILQFFTSFGLPGLIGAIVATALFAFLVMTLYQLGSRLRTDSHKEAIEYICGPYLGKVVDVALTLFLFGCVVVMLAGAGSSFEQQLGVPHYIGGAILCAITIITVCMGLDRVISLMSWITPVLMVIVAVIAVNAFMTFDRPFAELENIAVQQPQAAGNWLLSSLLYVSYNIAGTAAVLIVIGSSVTNPRSATRGGLLGGIGIGILIAIMTLVMLVKIDVIQGAAIPTLFLSNKIAPWFGDVMLVLLLIKLYATTSGLAYAFAARCKAYGLNFRVSVVVSVVAAFIASLAGFVKLVGIIYPFMGYLGFVLMACIVLAWFRQRRVPQSATAPLQ